MKDLWSELPEATELVDPVVHVHLVSGKIIGLQDISIVEVGRRLHNNGFVFLSDGSGSYAVFFSHGVAALTTHND